MPNRSRLRLKSFIEKRFLVFNRRSARLEVICKVYSTVGVSLVMIFDYNIVSSTNKGSS